jgi:hypothetical protein
MLPPRWSCLTLLLFVPAVRAEEPKPPAYPPAAAVREAFRKLLDRPAVPLNVKVHDTKTDGGLVTERLSFAAEKRSG